MAHPCLHRRGTCHCRHSWHLGRFYRVAIRVCQRRRAMKKLFYIENKTTIFLIKAESRSKAIDLFRPFVVNGYSEEEFTYMFGHLGDTSLYELDFSTGPVIPIAKNKEKSS